MKNINNKVKINNHDSYIMICCVYIVLNISNKIYGCI